MLARLLLGLLALLAASSPRPIHAGTVDGREWPPDPKRYAAPGTPVAPGLAIGDVLSARNASLAKDLLPPEVLKHYREGRLREPDRVLARGDLSITTARSRSHAARTRASTTLDAKSGTILEKATGKTPDTSTARRSRRSRPDPQAGLKALWNQFHNYWNTGSYNFNALIVWVAPKGVDRQSLQDVYAQYYENQNPAHRSRNPQNFSWQLLSNAKTPADLQGTAALSYRFRDPTSATQSWTYVPALRRVRPSAPRTAPTASSAPT